MGFDAFGYAVARIKEREADIYVGDGTFADEDLLYSMGAVRGIKVVGEPRTTTPDSHGREYQKGVNLDVTWIVMQNDYSVEMTEIPGLREADRLMVKVTDVEVVFAEGGTVEETQQNASTAAHAADGIEFENARVSYGFDLDFDGEDSIFTLNMKGRLSNDKVKLIGNAPVILGNV